MSEQLMLLKDEFLMILYEMSKMRIVRYIADFVQGEDALMLRLLMNESLTPKELSDNLKITKGRVTAIVNRLKNKGYLNTTINLEDKRSIHITLSNFGKDELMKRLNIADQYFAHLFAVLGNENANSLVNELQKLVKKVREENL